MSDMNESHEEKTYPVKQSATFAGSTIVTMGIVDVLAHLGPTGLLVSGIASYVAWRHGPELYEQVGGLFPSHTPAAPKEQSEHAIQPPQRSGRSFLDRALGRYPEGYGEDEQDLEAATDDEGSDEDANASFDDVFVPEPVFPHYEDRVTLQLGKAIDREALATLTTAFEVGKYQQVTVPGRRFDPHFNHLLGKGWVSAANQGFGKSILNGVMIEQAGECGLPVIVLDHKGEYDTVKELGFMNTLLVGARGNVDFLLTPEVVDDFVELVFTHRYQAIVNLPSYGTGWLGKARISAAIGQALMRYAEKQRQLGKKLLPCLIIMDEAQLYLPQDQSLLPPEAQANRDVLSDLKNAYFALVSNGRSAGYTLGFATQSLTYLAKWAIKSSQIRIFGRHAEKNDLDACEQMINPTVATREQIEAFPPGVAVVFGFTTQPVVVQFDRKQSRDLSQTPRIELLHERHRQLEQPPALEHATTERPRFIREVPRRPFAETAHTTRYPAAGRTHGLRAVLDAYVPGMTYRDLGAALGYTDREAREIWQELRRRGLLRSTAETTRQVEAPHQGTQAQPAQKSELELALEAYDAGHTTIDALAVALEKTPWTVRPLYQQVKQIRGQKVG